jgi:hypothetical protein
MSTLGKIKFTLFGFDGVPVNGNCHAVTVDRFEVPENIFMLIGFHCVAGIDGLCADGEEWFTVDFEYTFDFCQYCLLFDLFCGRTHGKI